MHQHAKFRADRASRGRFYIFNMAVFRHLGFSEQKFEILTAIVNYRAKVCTN